MMDEEKKMSQDITSKQTEESNTAMNLEKLKFEVAQEYGFVHTDEKNKKE